MRINTNVASLTAREAATNTNNNISSSLEKLSTGLRINKASDDASGLAIADKLRTQASSTSQAISNGNSAVSLLQIADKSMSEQSNILDTVKAKLIQANTDTTSAEGREAIRKDISKLLEQLDNIATQTNYNGISLLADVSNGSLTGKAADSLNFQIGASNTDIISTAEINSTTSSLGGGDTTISEIAANSTESLQNGVDGKITISDDDTNTLDLTISGDLGVVSSVGQDIQIQVSDAATMSKLDAVAADNTNFTKSSTVEGLYTLSAGQSADLAGITLTNAIFTGAATGADLTVKGDNFTVTNNDLINKVTVTQTETLSEGESTTVSKVGDDAKLLTVSSTAAGAVNVNVSGDLGTLAASGGTNLTLTTTNSAEIAKLEQIVNDINDTSVITSNGDGEFTLLDTKSVDLSGIDFDSLNIKAVTDPSAAGTVFSMDTKEDVTITTNGSVDISISNAEVKGAENLATLKNLGEGELTQELASKFQTVVDDAISQLNTYRAEIGSSQNQVESAVRNLQTQETNVLAAESIIRDVDYAAESSNFNKQNIISQAGSYAMSQANSVQQNVLRLLQ